jgi:uncharacterized protein YndB with AHSA1/START domain
MATGTSSYTMPTDREIRVTRVAAAPMAAIFGMWTVPANVQRWLLGPEGWSMPVCEIDLRAGGEWRYVWRKRDGREMAMGGSYREVRPPSHVVWTEKWGPEWPETVNTLELTDAGAGTSMTITTIYPDQASRDAALRTGMQDGIEASFARLDRLLAAESP